MNSAPSVHDPTHRQGETMTVPTLDPSSPFGYAELLIRSRIHRARTRLIRGPRDLGASAVEWVIISALVIGVCVAVSAALKTKLTGQVAKLNVGDQT
jgi:hypothetical protein